MAVQTFDFERPILELEDKIETFRNEPDDDPNAGKNLRRLEKELADLKTKVYSNLTPMQRVLLARHMMRPRSLDYIQTIFTDWVEIKGDRNFRDDPALVTGLARFDGKPVAIVGQQKGKDTNENVHRNFGMMHPEGYRKAMRLIRLAERFQLPVVILIDTPGAYPGIGAEERGQAEAIARNIMEMFTIRVPLIGAVIGEGASGGALGVGVVDYMMMFENSWYCVISPEGCAAILWRDAAMAPSAADALKLTATDLLELQVIDESLPEPLGGAHRDPKAAMETLRQALLRQLKRLSAKSVDKLLKERQAKYRAMGVYAE
ncbi:acetyl-CoA carboxylase carboxyltransferase subunit alpha [Candidatus Sumerlaeota bacterium]|nr:acetyl-CoA carboxylase carboxyltransferase subunit alpha [Candidatus Sumerlaeota bacterium]